MIAQNHILDTQLPLELDFKALKAAGLAYIQKHSGNEWTNLNPSDPGVTILEQLCYAFTELGYCTNFPMKDILTNSKDELILKNQFYLPENILTTSPITSNDYIKYIIDQITAVKNVIVKPIRKAVFGGELYEVFLQLDVNYSNTTVTSNPFLDTYFLLNSCRNLGDVFLMPQPLSTKLYGIEGKLTVENGYDIHTILATIISEVNAYVFPEVMKTGYDKLKATGITTNSIFNGPNLTNGWIPTTSIQPKKDSIEAFEITKIIQDIEGVSSIMAVSFIDENGTKSTTATCKEDELLVFDFTTSQSKNKTTSTFKIDTNGKQIRINTAVINDFSTLQNSISNSNTVGAVQMRPTLPTGKYRDITNYYSIQNTLPEIYNTGLNATNTNTPDYEVAQSRQLKGYLTLFDQLLSNQFAQLANINTLFSFENATTGTPTDKEAFFRTKNKTEKEHLKYPAPYSYFSPTYFYQSLYTSVPNIEPLLKNNTIFDFGFTTESEEQLKKRSIKEYKDDPYNSYIHGLMLLMEEETENVKRRNEILDHLLARHGESPETIEAIIYTDVYSGDVLKDMILIKSMYLQNLEVLSYYRTKSHDFISATKLDEELPVVTEAIQNELSQGSLNDFILNSIKITENEHVTAQDFINYTTFELKLSMLLAIKQHYTNFIVEAALNTANNLALWMITQRSGLITVEMSLLLQSATFQFVIKDGTSKEFKESVSQMTYYEFVKFQEILEHSTLEEQIKIIESQQYKVVTSCNAVFREIPNSIYSWTVVISSWSKKCTTDIFDPIFENDLILIFPDFVDGIITPEFKERLNYYLESQLPIHVNSTSLFVNENNLSALIPKYTAWYNALTYATSEVTEEFGDDLSYNPTAKEASTWYTDLVINQETEKLQHRCLVHNATQLFSELVILNTAKND